VTAREIDETQRHKIDEAIRSGVKYVYWDYLDGGGTSTTIADPLGRTLQLDHAPYGGRGGLSPWLRFSDDLISFAYRYPGLVIVVDHADSLLRERPDEMFDLVEAFLTQFHHWYDQKKPCHLCFQMVRNDSIRRIFLGGGDDYLRACSAGMEKEPEPTRSMLWDIYLSIRETEVGHVGMLVATVEAADENEAIEKVPPSFKQLGRKLMAVPARRDAGLPR
jgi:hypothetical protein